MKYKKYSLYPIYEYAILIIQLNRNPEGLIFVNIINKSQKMSINKDKTGKKHSQKYNIRENLDEYNLHYFIPVSWYNCEVSLVLFVEPVTFSH